MKRRHLKEAINHISIQTKLLLSFGLAAIMLFAVNFIVYGEISYSMRKLDAVYMKNVSLTELSNCLEETQQDIEEYLTTKSSDSLEDYYRNVQEYQDMLEELNGEIVDDQMEIFEKNIKNMSETYLVLSDDTILAKRGRNVERYKALYLELYEKYQYIQNAIYCLNSLQFGANSINYRNFLKSMQYMEAISIFMMVVVVVITLIILVVMIRSITEPLRNLAKSANEVAAGNFNIKLEESESQDEVGIVTSAFSQMVESIRNYIEQTRLSMEKERKMKEQELLMETHLKDAQLKYLQAQINPHFLFNSLNAGAQLAMMEDAEKTSIFIEKMADFFRYNVRKNENSTTLKDELEAVDNYVYILNVRFAGDIHFTKEVDDAVVDAVLPSMILQPIVENAVNHGIRNVEWEGCIELLVEQEGTDIMIQVRDNGEGMTQERIREVMGRESVHSVDDRDSTGIGLDNVMNRLELYYNRKNLFRIESDGPGTGTTVMICIPYVIEREEQGHVQSTDC